jgi:hypothetical protein
MVQSSRNSTPAGSGADELVQAEVEAAAEARAVELQIEETFATEIGKVEPISEDEAQVSARLGPIFLDVTFRSLLSSRRKGACWHMSMDAGKMLRGAPLHAEGHLPLARHIGCQA